MEYVFPRQNLDNVNDQFMLGNNLLVAPMVSKGRARTVLLPKGKWRADDGKVYKGPAKVNIDVPLERLPFFERTR
jgi:alpha-glucosidase